VERVPDHAGPAPFLCAPGIAAWAYNPWGQSSAVDKERLLGFPLDDPDGRSHHHSRGGIAAGGGLAAWYLHGLQREASDLLVASVAKVRAAEEMELVGYRLRARLNEYLLTGDRSTLAAVPALQNDAAGWIAQARTLAEGRQEVALVSAIERGYQRFLAEYRQVDGTPPPQAQREAILRLVQQVTKDDILRPAAEYRDLNQRRMAEASRRGQKIADRMGLTLLLLGMCGAVAGLLGGFGIARGVQRSMVQLAVPIRDASGKLEEIVGPITVFSDPSFHGLETALHDLSGKVGDMVERVHESHRAAARAEQLAAVGQLAAGLAHELRNPLTSIKVLVQGARDVDASGGLHGRDLMIVEEEIDRLNRTIQTFLDYARPPQPVRSRFSLRDVLQQTVDLLSARAGQLGVRIHARFPPDSMTIEADEGQVRQVLLNLFINALEASPQGGTIDVCMDYEPQAEPKTPVPKVRPIPWVRVEVADSGPGLPTDLGQRIFEPFVSTKDTGTGLGLAICRRIVEEHGGSIAAWNRAEGGALFTICLPVGSSGEPCDSKGLPSSPA
jgi:two-component system, NtrC family, sensor histidine kinase HydH